MEATSTAKACAMMQAVGGRGIHRIPRAARRTAAAARPICDARAEMAYSIASPPIRWRRPARSVHWTVKLCMYQPQHFCAHFDNFFLRRMHPHTLMRTRPFATLVSVGSLGSYATHPQHFSGRWIVRDHRMSSRSVNPHCRDLSTCNKGLMIFQGAQSYITPNWYPSNMERSCPPGTMRSYTPMVGLR